MKQIIKNISIGIFSLILMLVYVPFSAYAADTGTIVVRLTECEFPIDTLGTDIKLYKIADRTDTGTLTLAEDFADSGINAADLKSASAAQMNQIAKTLAAYAEEKTGPDESFNAVLDEDTTIEGLDKGAYLLTIDTVNGGRYHYVFSPMVILIPSVNESGQDCWQIDAVPKFSLDNSTWTETGTQTTEVTSHTLNLASTTSTTETTTVTETMTSTRPVITASTTVTTSTVSTVTSSTTTVTTTTTAPPPSGTTDERLPQTGVLVWVVYLLAGVGVISLITLWGFCRKEGSGKVSKFVTLIVGCGCLVGAVGMYAEPYFAERASVPVMSMALSELRKAQPETHIAEIPEENSGMFTQTEEEVLITEDAAYAEESLELQETQVQAVPQTYVVSGNYYIGILEIPALGLELPIAADCSMGTLSYAPGYYSGAAETGNLVIGAHNYNSHFGTLYLLSAGAEVTFTDVDGNLYQYRVTDVTEVAPNQAAEVRESGHDLALFTCNSTGARRVVVYCDMIE